MAAVRSSEEQEGKRLNSIHPGLVCLNTAVDSFLLSGWQVRLVEVSMYNINRLAGLQFVFRSLSNACLLFIGAALRPGPWVCAAVHYQILAVCLLANKKKKKPAKWCANVAYWRPAWKWGQSEFEWQSWRHVPTCPLSFETVFGSVSSSLAVSLISSRQAVWRGLKSFTEPSPGLINTHFLLEILAQTHHGLLVIRWWHPVPPWLTHVHRSIQCWLVRGMHIKETACHHFILESKDYCSVVQPCTLSLLPFSIAPSPSLIFFMLLHAFTD